ncbi:MAG: hypothetical protein DRN17_04110 [Thermoplasmata archaeon]|nr:MAG: hypothetical protein DRN17_04110 [Thermoplasmata archaeon]
MDEKVHRKINCIGGRSLCVVIPHKWAVYNNLQVGGKVDVITKNNEMIVRLKTDQGKEKQRHTPIQGRR